jgi:TetR/AcrR family transcriptional regulator, copper-responsive repressor
MSSDAKKPRRGRPREYDPERALADAMSVFWRSGYDGASLDDLAAATGLNRPSLYAGFGDKRELYLETLRSYREMSKAAGRKLLAEPLPLREFLRRFYDAALDFYFDKDERGRGCYSVLAAATRALVDPEVREFVAEGIRATDGLLTRQIAGARDRGEISSSADPETLAQLASATMHTLAMRARAGESRERLRALAAGAIETICGRPTKPA